MKNTKVDQLKKKLMELSNIFRARQGVLDAERKEKEKLIETITHYKKNLQEREDALAEKEKVILELRSTTRTLDNFRWVLLLVWVWVFFDIQTKPQAAHYTTYYYVLVLHSCTNTLCTHYFYLCLST